jgi:murein tripeptide amidase MpaA
MAYLNVTEIESALQALSTTYPAICQLISLPNSTAEGQQSSALRIGTQDANTVDAYYLTGNVHAEEWGSSEILINLATDLCDAYTAGTGLGYHRKYYSAAQVKALVEQLNIIIFPCVNPDGRRYSQSDEPGASLWRKNRNPKESEGVPELIGVDLNRNQDFLWHYETAFDPAALVDISSQPSSDVYRGSAPQSEPETKNINYLHDTFTRIKWYIDLHSFAEDILYMWHDDELQDGEPDKNFINSAYDGKRGVIGDAYSEFIRSDDLASLIRLANAFTRSLHEVRGKSYVAKPGFSLYPAPGGNDDYAYSRHIVDPTKSKTLSFTVEWGTAYQPDWAEMEEVIRDVCSGLIGFGLEALGINSFIVTNRDTFSSYELEATLSYPQSFYVIYDGFAPSAIGAPGVSPEVHFFDSNNNAEIYTISATADPCDLEDPGAPDQPQRVSFTFKIEFTDASAFTTETRDIYVLAIFAGMQDAASMRLIKQPNPYMSDGPISWLSTDVRVFKLEPTGKVNSFSNVALADPDTDEDAPYNYIQGLLTELRSYGNDLAPPFENISQDEQASQLELSRTVGGKRVLNFAVAKVRYRANTQDAVDVRVFFRTFNTMVSDLSYTGSIIADLQNYRRTIDGEIPLLGINHFHNDNSTEIVSIPYFAQKRVDSSIQDLTTQLDDWNKHTVNHAVGEESVQYFGCWLDFNQTEPQFPVSPVKWDGPFTDRMSIAQLVRGIHQCLVAEIRYQPASTDPIPWGATPASSDRLAQRNLAILESGNPGGGAAHLVAHTLLIKPSIRAAAISDQLPATGSASAGKASRYDELVIRWHELPRDTTVNLYSPDWHADEVMALASSLRPSRARIAKVDAHTISCAVGDITYIPLPSRGNNPIPCLLTLQLPRSVRAGQEYRIDIQQHSGLVYRRTVASGAHWELRSHGQQKERATEWTESARKVLGAFRLTVVVKADETLLRTAVRNLAVLRYIFAAIPRTDSWHAVFDRYIDQISQKVKALGGDPDLIEASADDPGTQDHDITGEWYTGKIAEVIFDCFGDFEGFILRTCEERFYFRSAEKNVQELVMKACKERLLLSVCVTESDKIRKIVVLSGRSEREHASRWKRIASI